jgi:DNA-binding response OmpR family regulator
VIEHAWDYDFDGGRNLVEVYMGRLRRKLADAGVRDPFVTVRGSGYRLEATS